ncbi:GGDEF domain-containing protein [Pseudoxanthomonas sangjuensis]|uniref:GGDEF domain-containing protein n=1 Tax=Pseudoxanthomonas sangjuensis TaxID=1503750 RepID=UPI001391A201|nr:GGDEF domain-containing protein [Pseudoxanthomonas sangjuensis]
MGDIGPSAASRRLRDAAMIGGLVFAACWLGILSRPEQQLASFWPTNALLLGLFARRPALATPLAWIAAALAYLAADLATGSALSLTLHLTAANLAGVAVGYALFLRIRREDRDLQQPQSMLWVLLVCVCAALAAAMVGNPTAGADFGIAFGNWFSAELISYLTLVPVVLLMPRPGDLYREWRGRALQPRHTLGRWLPALALLLTVLMGVLIGGPGAIAFPVPALLWCALRYRLFVTATATLLLCAWTLVAIANDWIPLHLQRDMAAVISMRIGMALVAVAPLTVAGVIATRDRLLAALYHATSHDSLTQALSRGAFMERGRAVVAEAAAADRTVAVMMVDVDHFKSINDRHGHAVGDAVLVAFVRRALDQLRGEDLLCRFGGEEFTILMSGVDEASALLAAERLRSSSAQPLELENGPTMDITVSIGLAVHAPPQGDESLEALINRADRALYRAKASGRNRVELEGPPSPAGA